jgi:PAS domain S-box-containing protein
VDPVALEDDLLEPLAFEPPSTSPAAAHETDLSTLVPGATEHRVAIIIVVSSVLAFVAAAPFARVPLAPVPAFIPGYEAALAINDLITAVLLFGQFAQLRSRALLALASGYLFDALIIVPHALSYPGVFADAGLLGGGSQTTAWLYMLWHGGFPAFVVAYALLDGRMKSVAGAGRVVSSAVLLVGALVGGLTLIATAGQEALPAIMAGNIYAPGMTLVASSVWALSLVALLAIWRKPRRSALDLWLVVVMFTWLFDVALSAVLNGGRFDAGFYAGRLYGLLAASFVLGALLIETSGLHVRLARAQARLTGHARELEARVRARTTELARSNETLKAEIAERRQAEQESARTRAFLDVIVESIPATIAVKEARERKYLLINKAGEELLGCDRSAVIGRTVHNLLPRTEADAVDAHDREVISSGRPYETSEHPITTPHRGARLVRTRTMPVPGDDGRPRYVVSIAEDVTERRQIEAQLRQAQKMEAIGTLTGGMAHDFNNLLGVIIGNLDLLRGFVKENPTIDELAGEALDAALRGADLTRRLLAFARRQPLQPARIDVNELVDGITKLLGRTLGEHIALEVRLAPDLWPVVADPAQLEAAITNLATNARDAMPDGGRLVIATGQRALDADYASLHPEVVPGDFAMIEVSDNGIGMPPDVMARIFEPFFTTKEAGKGTGLGLSMVFGFMKQSGGHISVYSEPGVGTTFRLYLRRTADGAEIDARNVVQDVPLGRGETVLAVEDNAPLRRIVVRQLTELGYRALEAESASAALAILENTDVDLLFSDVVMPGELSGLELARTAVAKRPNLRVLLTSGFPGTKIAGSLGEAATARLLSKPYRKADLGRALRAAFGG